MPKFIVYIRSLLKITIGFSLAALLVGGNTPSHAKIYSYRYLTNNESSDIRACVDKDIVVWLGTDANGYGVLYLNLVNNTQRNITSENGIVKTSSNYFGNPSLSEGNVAFRVHDEPTNMDSVYLYDAQIDSLKLLASFPSGSFGGTTGYPPSQHSLRPMIDGKEVTWAQWDGNDYEIMYFANGTTIQVTNNTYDDFEPQIHQGMISWTGRSSSSVYDVYLWDGFNIQNISFDRPSDSKCEDSFLHDGKVVFTSRNEYEDKFYEFDIYLWDGGSISHISSTYGNDYEPEINSNNLIAWNNYGRKQKISDGKAIIWDGYRNYNVLPDIELPHPHIIYFQSTYGSKVVLAVDDGNDLEIVLADYIKGEMKAEDGESMVDVVSGGDIAYVLSDSGTLKTLDMKSLDVPVEIHQQVVEDLSGYHSIVKSDKALFLSRRNGGIDILDISTPQAPVTASKLTLAASYELATSGKLLYVSAGVDGFQIYDVNDVQVPVLLSTVPPEAGAVTVDVEISEILAITAERTGGMRIIDISDPSVPQVVSTYQPGSLDSVAVSKDGDIVYLLGADSVLRVLSIADPSAPILLAICSLPATEQAQKYEISKVQSHLFLSIGVDGIFVLDVWDPASPEIVERIDTLGSVGGLGLKDNHLVVADGKDGLKIIDISDYYSPAVATIKPVTGMPDKVYETQSYVLSGFGEASSGSVVAYEWSSDMDGIFSTGSTADVLPLGYGLHEIGFKVQHIDGSWSQKKTMELFLYPGVPIKDEDLTLTEIDTGVWQTNVSQTGSFEFRYGYKRISDGTWFYSPYSSDPVGYVPNEIIGEYKIRALVRNVNSVTDKEAETFDYGTMISTSLEFENFTIGRPKYSAGTDLGYYLWQDADDGEWHIRWSGDGVHNYIFSGTIDFGSIIPDIYLNGFEAEDTLMIDGNRVTFSAVAGAGEDGIDFFLAEDESFIYDFYIDDIKTPETVRIGMNGDEPDSMPGVLVTQATPEDTSSIGKPAYIPAQDAGVFLWQDTDDGQWHVRFSGDGVSTYHFSGKITVSSSIGGLQLNSIESNDAIESNETEIQFDCYAGAGEDGIDFFTSPNAVLHVQISIDGSQNPDMVYIGQNAYNPLQVPFLVLSSAGIEDLSATGTPAYIPAVDAGYFLWQDADTSRWHIRFSGDSIRTYRYSGTLVSNYAFYDVTPVSFEGNDDIVLKERTIGFEAFAGGGEDGFDFSVPPGAHLTFELLVDGSEDTTRVFIGESMSNPDTLPFALQTAGTVVDTQVVGEPVYTSALDLGYYVWKDSNSNWWHIRWSGDSIHTYHFNGMLTASSGFTEVLEHSFESNDISQSGDSILSFDAYAGAGEDGLDFLVAPDTLVSFDLYIDGIKQPTLLFIGPKNSSPGAIPFSLNGN